MLECTLTHIVKKNYFDEAKGISWKYIEASFSQKVSFVCRGCAGDGDTEGAMTVTVNLTFILWFSFKTKHATVYFSAYLFV